MPGPKKDLAKELAIERTELTREQKRWQVTKAGIEREITHLTAKASDLDDKAQQAEVGLSAIRKELETERLRLDGLKAKNSELERDNHSLETEATATRSEIEKLEAAITDRKDSVDQELLAYELKRKQEIKDKLLSVNQELLDANTALADTQRKHADLVETLNQLQEVYRTEQEELKASSKSTTDALAANTQRVEASETRVRQLEDQIRDLMYRRDNIQAELDKSKAEHEKFVTYEREARKVLDAKDKQLQARSAEIGKQGQFIEARRSFLPEL